MIEPVTREDPLTAVRLRPSQRAWIEAQAQELGISMSMVIRCCIAYAAEQPNLFGAWAMGEGVARDTSGVSIAYTPGRERKG